MSASPIRKAGPLHKLAPWGLAAAAFAVVWVPAIANLGSALAQPAPAGPQPAPSASTSAAPVAPAAPPPSAAPAPTLPTAPTIQTPPKPPDPSADQIAALAAMQQEADAYTSYAKDYRSAMTKIVEHHYEEERRRILGALDRELGIEKQGLVDAREEAIKRLEAFVAKYSGANAQPEATPDAMFRLAALYEEKVRDDAEDPGDRLKPAIALYKDIIQKFPKYRELAAVYYYLGHALNDSNRIEEAQQVWRSLVCHNVFAYPVDPDPTDATKDTVKQLPGP